MGCECGHRQTAHVRFTGGCGHCNCVHFSTPPAAPEGGTSLRWFEVMAPPLRGARSHSILSAMDSSDRALQDARNELRAAAKEAEAARKVLAAVIQQAGGEIVITNSELDNINVFAAIHTEHNSDTNSTRIWTEVRP